MSWLPGVHRSPHLQRNPWLHEISNAATDPAGQVAAELARIAPWSGRLVVDLGAGSGFHLEALQATARHVFAVEPDDATRQILMARIWKRGLERVSAVTGSAERLLLPDASVDRVFARLAYFWGPGCERGIAEVSRVLVPGGIFVVIDRDLVWGDVARWAAREEDARDPATVEAFWRAQGFRSVSAHTRWVFNRRDEAEAVFRAEFSPENAARIIAEEPGLDFSMGFRLYTFRTLRDRQPTGNVGRG